MSINVKSRLQKGSKGEADVLIDLQQILAAEYKTRGLPLPMMVRGRHGTDIQGLDWLSPEIKRHEPTLGFAAVTEQQKAAFWEQAKRQCKPGQIPCLVYRQNHQPWRVRIPGYVEISGGRRLATPVDIAYDAFLIWFRAELAARLAHIPLLGS